MTLSDNEIIKALECCCKNNDCEGCPLDYLTFSSQCASELSIKSLDLINRQKSEIGRLNLENSQMIASIKRLKKFYETYTDDEEASALYLVRQINEIVKEMKGNNDE